MKRENAISYGSVFLGAVLWGFIGLFSRGLSAQGLSSLNTAVVRNMGALLLLTLFFLLRNRRVFRIQVRHFPWFFAMGCVSILGSTICYVSCLARCSMAVGAILLYLAPSFVVLMSAVFWKEPLTRRKLIALALSVLGCALVSGVMDSGVTVTVTGLLFGIGAGFCYATYSVFGRYVLAIYPTFTVIFWAFFCAGLCSLLCLDVSNFTAVMGQQEALGNGLGLVVIGTVLPYLFYTTGLSRLEAGKAAILASLEPVSAAVLGVLVFHEHMSLWMLTGMGLVLGSVYLLTRQECKQEEVSSYAE